MRTPPHFLVAPYPNCFANSSFLEWHSLQAFRLDGASQALAESCQHVCMYVCMSVCVSVCLSVCLCMIAYFMCIPRSSVGTFFCFFSVSSKNNAHFIQKRSIRNKTLNWKIVVVVCPHISAHVLPISAHFPPFSALSAHFPGENLPKHAKSRFPLIFCVSPRSKSETSKKKCSEPQKVTKWKT